MANPIVDGHVLPDWPLAALRSGKVINVPLLAGNVGNGTFGFPHLASLANCHAYVNASFGEQAQ